MGPSTGNAFDRLRMEAKFLLKDARHGDEAALRRFTQYWPASGPSGEVRNLARAQLVIARERGYRSWTHLKTSLLGNEERIMSEQKNAAVPERRLGVYTYEEAESLLGIPKEQIRTLAEEIEKKPHRYIDAVLMEKIWVKAKPFLVTLKRKATAPRLESKAEQVAQLERMRGVLLSAGATRTMTAIQWRFATRAEAELIARQQAPVEGWEWVAIAFGYSTRKPETNSWHVDHSEDSVENCFIDHTPME